MAKLEDKAENALNETRMLILGAQVLIGFNFQSAFQPGFERLTGDAQVLKLLGLALMLVAVALLIAPCAFHQIVERGNDSQRLIGFTGRIASFALLPFAFGLGIGLYLAAAIALGPQFALPVGLFGLIFALFFWYGLDWAWRARDQSLGMAQEAQPMDETTSLENKIKQVLTEARVVLPGAQALLGFQLAAMLTDAFEKLPKSSQYVHVACLGLLAMTIVFLMAPAAFHRIVERGEDTERLHHFSSAMVLAAMVPLALGIAGDFYVVVAKVLDSPGLALAVAILSLLAFYGLWFGLTLAIRTRIQASRGPLRVSRAVR
ncbi:MAG TPA: DUF6328 family protein [Chloroflexota bacterium]|nr:DUF6328 family protein [Chloroflexota bacterium]